MPTLPQPTTPTLNGPVLLILLIYHRPIYQASLTTFDQKSRTHQSPYSLRISNYKNLPNQNCTYPFDLLPQPIIHDFQTQQSIAEPVSTSASNRFRKNHMNSLRPSKFQISQWLRCAILRET